MKPCNASLRAAEGLIGFWVARGTMELAMVGTYPSTDLFLAVAGLPREGMWLHAREAV